MPAVINRIAEAYGWQAAYQGVGFGLIAVAFPVAYLLVRDAPREPSATTVGARAPFALGTLLHSRAFWHLAVAFACLGVFTSTAIVNMIGVLEENGMVRRAAVLALSVMALATIVGRLSSGLLLDRYRINLVIPGFALLGAGAIFALSLGTVGAPAYVCAACIGLLVGAEIDVLGYSVKRFFGLPRYGAIFGILFAIFHIGGAFGGYAMGLGSRIGQGFSLGLWFATGAATIAAILFATLPSPGGARPLFATV